MSAQLKPGDLTPAPKPVKRTLYVETEGDVGRESTPIDPGEEDDRALMLELGWVRFNEHVATQAAAANASDSELVEECKKRGFHTYTANASDQELLKACGRRGLLPKGEWTPSHDNPVDFPVHDATGAQIGTASPLGDGSVTREPIRMVGAERAELELAPPPVAFVLPADTPVMELAQKPWLFASERVKVLAAVRRTQPGSLVLNDELLADVLQLLDERLGRALA